MEGSKTSFHSSKFPRAREGISSKFIDNLAIYPQEGSPALLYSIGLQPFLWRMVTSVTLDWFAGLTWKNNSNWCT